MSRRWPAPQLSQSTEKMIAIASTAMEVWAIVVAAGSGTRFGRLKQLDPLGPKRVLDWSVDAMPSPQRTIIVVPADQIETINLPDHTVVAGGATRSASVRAGLAALPSSASHVLIHDGARPLVSPAVIARVVQAMKTADGVIPVIPVTDTLRHHDGSPVDRSELVAVQTPQGFSVSILQTAHASGNDATDDAGLVTAAGGVVVHVEGDPANIKVTVPSDLLVAEALLRERD